MNTKLIIGFLFAGAICLAEGPPGDLLHQPEFQKKVGLSDAQKAKIETIMKRDRDRMVDLRADLQKKEFRLQDAFEAEAFDAGKARTAQAAVAKAKMALDELRMEQRIAVRSEVTLKQFRILEAMHRHHGRHGKRPGPDGRGPGYHKDGPPVPPPPPPAPGM